MSHTAIHANNASLEPLSAALHRAGVELDAVAQMVIDLEDVVGHAISAANSTRELQIEELQQLDRARQKIEGAAEFLRTLTQMLPAEWLIDAKHAARSVSMSDLASRLAGLTDAHLASPVPDDYEVF